MREQTYLSSLNIVLWTWRRWQLGRPSSIGIRVGLFHTYFCESIFFVENHHVHHGFWIIVSLAPHIVLSELVLPLFISFLHLLYGLGHGSGDEDWVILRLQSVRGIFFWFYASSMFYPLHSSILMWALRMIL